MEGGFKSNLRKFEINLDELENFILTQNKPFKKIFPNLGELEISKNKESEDFENFYMFKYKFGNEKNISSFFGFLNKKFLKNFFGRFTYPNKDFYSGEIKEDLKSGMGIYKFHDKGIFVGSWEKNEKQCGVQIWKIENEKPSSAFIGNFCDGYYKKGLYISFNNDIKNINSQSQISDNYIYFGEFDKNGKKNYDNSFLFDVERKRIFYGSVKDDKAVSGYYYEIRSVPSENSIDYIMKNVINFDTFQNEENSIKEVSKNPAIDTKITEKISLIISTFLKSFILGMDWVKIIQKYNDDSNQFSKAKDPSIGFTQHVNQQIEKCKEYLKLLDLISDFEKSYNIIIC
jgi:hypothetical protein